MTTQAYAAPETPNPSSYTPDLEHAFEVALATARRYSTGRRQNPAEQQAYLQRIDQLLPRLALGPPFTPDELDTLRRACTGTLAALDIHVPIEGRVTPGLLEFALVRLHAWAHQGHPQGLVA